MLYRCVKLPAILSAALICGMFSEEARAQYGQPIASPKFSFPALMPGGLPPTPLQVGIGQPYWYSGDCGVFKLGGPGRYTSFAAFSFNHTWKREWMTFVYRTSTVYVYQLNHHKGTYFAFSTCAPFTVWVSSGGVGWSLFQKTSRAYVAEY